MQEIVMETLGAGHELLLRQHRLRPIEDALLRWQLSHAEKDFPLTVEDKLFESWPETGREPVDVLALRILFASDKLQGETQQARFTDLLPEILWALVQDVSDEVAGRFFRYLKSIMVVFEIGELELFLVKIRQLRELESLSRLKSQPPSVA